MERGALSLAPDEAELARLGRVADRVLASRAFFVPGTRSASRRAGTGHEFLGLRDYAPGDDPRRVDWRASARTERLQVRETLDERAGAWLVLVDTSASMAVRDGEKWRLAFQLAAAWSYLLLRAGHRVALAAASDRLDLVQRPGRGRRHYLRLLRALADTRPRPRGGGSELATGLRALPRGAGVTLVSDFLAPDAMARTLDGVLAASGAVQALQVLAPEECALGAVRDGGARVVDVESGATRVVAAGGAERATARLAALRESLAAHCARRGIPLTSAHSDERWRDVLVRHLALLERRRA
jgi:uncharacterized protein (DUF58 family)